MYGSGLGAVVDAARLDAIFDGCPHGLIARDRSASYDGPRHIEPDISGHASTKSSSVCMVAHVVVVWTFFAVDTFCCC